MVMLAPMASGKRLNFRGLTGHLRPSAKLGEYAQNSTLVKTASHGRVPRPRIPDGLRLAKGGCFRPPVRSLQKQGLTPVYPSGGCAPATLCPALRQPRRADRGASVPLTDYPGEGAIAPLTNPLAGAVRAPTDDARHRPHDQVFRHRLRLRNGKGGYHGD
jgi:hypothetical protein